MKTFVVTIEETVAQSFEIEAEDSEQASDIASERYYSGDIVLEPGEVTGRLMQVDCDETGESTEWFTF